MLLTCILVAGIFGQRDGAKEAPVDLLVVAPTPSTGSRISGGTSVGLNDAPCYCLPRITGVTTGVPPSRQSHDPTTCYGHSSRLKGCPTARPSWVPPQRHKLTDADLGKSMGLQPYGQAQHHRWLRNGAVMSGATARSYRLTLADRGLRAAVRVTGSKPLFTSVTTLILGASLVAPSYTAGAQPRPAPSRAPLVGSGLNATPWNMVAAGPQLPVAVATRSLDSGFWRHRPQLQGHLRGSVIPKPDSEALCPEAGWTSGSAMSGPVGRILPARSERHTLW